MPHNVLIRWPLVSLFVLIAALATFVVMRRALEQSSTTTLRAASRANAHVSIASDGTSRVVVAWAATGEAGTDVYAAISEDGGLRYSEPIRVNDRNGDASVSGEQPPRVTIHGRTIAVVWVSKRDGGASIRSAMSTDGGRSFSPASTLTPPALHGARGWESAAIDDDGALHAVWLDGRDAAPMAHQHGATTGAAPRQDVFHAVWRQDGMPTETRVAENVCFCCKTSVVARGPDIYAAWRHLYDGGVRDIAVAHSADGGRTFAAPVRVSDDNWKLNACPDDGPALAIDAGGLLHVAWPTMTSGEGRPRIGIFHAVSRDGRTFSPRERVDEGNGSDPAHPRIAADASGRVAIVWDELTDGQRRVAVRVLGNGNTLPVTRVDDGRSASYPAVAAVAGHFVVAWTRQDSAGSVIRVKSVR